MKNKLKTMLHSVIAVGFALLLLVLFEIPYAESVTGYTILHLYEGGGFAEFMSSFFQFFHIVAVLLLLNIGIFGILQKTGVVEVKKSLKGWTYAKLVSVLLLVIASLSLVELLFVIIVCAKYHAYIGVGAILNCVLEIMATVLFILLDKKGMLSGESHSTKSEEKEQTDSNDSIDAGKQENESDEAKQLEDEKDFEKFANSDIDTEKL